MKNYILRTWRKYDSSDHDLKILGALCLIAGGLVVGDSNKIVGGFLLLAGGGWLWALIMMEFFCPKQEPKTFEEQIHTLPKDKWIEELNKMHPGNEDIAETIYTKLKETNVKDVSNSSRMKKYLASKLTTKSRRKSFVVSSLGLMLTFLSLIFQPESFGDFLEMAFSNPSGTISPSRIELLFFKVNLFSQIFWLGLAMFILGLIGSVAYEETFGRIQKWINNGNVG